MDQQALMTYYFKYLKEIRKVSDSTVKHYREALKYISKYLNEKGKIDGSIYEIRDFDELESIRDYLYSDPDFIALNARGHQMYSAGLNNYCKFADGTGFSDIHNQIEILDTAMPATVKTSSKVVTWKRSSIIKIQTIEAAGYHCELDPRHRTFTAESSGHQYMEAHHALPMRYQDQFSNSLDVYANVICLCPICHRLLHYGIKSEKENALDKIYHDRADRLAASGIKISRDDFERFVV